MNWSFLIWFGIGLIIYLTALGVFVLVRFIIIKRKFKKELKDKEYKDIDTIEVNDNGKEKSVD